MTQSPALAALLSKFKSNDSTPPAPSPNPPEAAQVIEDHTAPEVAGEPEPPTEQEIEAVKKLEIAAAKKQAAAEATEARSKLPPKRLRRTVAQADAEIAELKERLSGELAAEPGEIAALSEEIEGLHRSNEEIEGQLAETTALAEELVKQNEVLKAQVDSGTTPSGLVIADATRVEDLVDELMRRGFAVRLTARPSA